MKTWKPTVAGILCIISGAPAIIVALIASVIGGTVGFLGMPFLSAIIGLVIIPIIILGVVSIVGGIFALRRERWGWALAGAICALVPPLGILGILAIIFVILSQDEFKGHRDQSPQPPPPPSPPPTSTPPASQT